MEQLKDARDHQPTAADEQRDRTANPTTLMELVLRRLAEIGEGSAAKDASKHETAANVGADGEP